MKGQCVCGETQFEVELKNHCVSSCHCSICRRQSSGVLMAVEVQQGSLQFSQQAYLGIYESSAWGERGFCKQCGTSLFWRSKDQQYCNINVFALNEQPQDLQLTTEIFIDYKPEFYAFDQQTKQLTEADIIAMYNP